MKDDITYRVDPELQELTLIDVGLQRRWNLAETITLHWTYAGESGTSDFVVKEVAYLSGGVQEVKLLKAESEGADSK